MNFILIFKKKKILFFFAFKIALDESKKANSKVISESKAPLDDLLSLNTITTNSNYQTPSTSTQFNNKINLIDPWSPQPQQQTTTIPNCLFFLFLINYKNFIFIVENLNSSSTLFTLVNNDPWSETKTTSSIDLFSNNTSGIPPQNLIPQNDPWAAFDIKTTNSTETNNFTNIFEEPKILEKSNINNNITENSTQQEQQRLNVKTPEAFLGENSSLVNLDNLMGSKSLQTKSG